MKETNSEITTMQKVQYTSIGTPAGERGFGTQLSSVDGQEPRTVEEWALMQKRQRSQIEQLDTHKTSLRSAKLVAILEVASAKIDRFGWNQMSQHVKDALCADWCDRLAQYTLAEVKQGVDDFFAANKGKVRSINEFQVEEQIQLRHRAITARLAQKDKINEQIAARKPELTEDEIARRKQVAADAR